jgi:acetyl-CoA carboxylase biotin carboxyl carrier protein
MDLDQLKQLLELVREHELSEFEVEQGGLRLKIRKDAKGQPAVVDHVVAATAAAPVASGPPAAPSAPSLAYPIAAGDDAEIELAVMKSPIVGTFYRASDPGTPAFVEIGTTVKRGQVLCIIEAMKLMNEIESEYDGEVANVYVENGQPVQYGERLFAIRTK